MSGGPNVRKKPACEDPAEVITGKRNIKRKGPEVGITGHMQETKRKPAWLECGEREGSVENEAGKTDRGQAE